MIQQLQSSSPAPAPVDIRSFLPRPAVLPPRNQPRRTRGARACDQCRKRRTKCIGGHPCSACTTAGDSCSFSDGPVKKRGPNAVAAPSRFDPISSTPSPAASPTDEIELLLSHLLDANNMPSRADSPQSLPHRRHTHASVLPMPSQQLDSSDITALHRRSSCPSAIPNNNNNNNATLSSPYDSPSSSLTMLMILEEDMRSNSATPPPMQQQQQHNPHPQQPPSIVTSFPPTVCPSSGGYLSARSMYTPPPSTAWTTCMPSPMMPPASAPPMVVAPRSSSDFMMMAAPTVPSSEREEKQQEA
ncbi:hypothetical protein HK101_001726, partial [Irineochytrium annulatum]